MSGDFYVCRRERKLRQSVKFVRPFVHRVILESSSSSAKVNPSATLPTLLRQRRNTNLNQPCLLLYQSFLSTQPKPSERTERQKGSSKSHFLGGGNGVWGQGQRSQRNPKKRFNQTHKKVPPHDRCCLRHSHGRVGDRRGICLLTFGFNRRLHLFI